MKNHLLQKETAVRTRPTHAFVLTLTEAGRKACPHPSSFAAGEAHTGMCVTERGPMAARRMAAAAAGDEGKAVWLDPLLSTCVELSAVEVPRVLVVGTAQDKRSTAA